jgi:ubiquinone/menaquinone biosynthesis C-methylase UbiE
MPTVADNLKSWDGDYPWPSGGDEWSDQFGGTDALWSFVLYPRVQRFLPAPAILEIAPGFGRWTQFLKEQCESLTVVDLSAKCIEQCEARFADDSHITYHVNDGSSLSAIQDRSIDFVFCFDSLVHAEKDVLHAYLAQLAQKLKPNGVGFIHHSNLGAYRGRLALQAYYDRLPPGFRKRVLPPRGLELLLSINFQGWRAPSMTADLFEQYCRESRLRCISQELFSWAKGRCLIDTISVFAQPDSIWDREPVRLENRRFLESARLTRKLAKLYAISSSSGPGGVRE